MAFDREYLTYVKEADDEHVPRILGHSYTSPLLKIYSMTHQSGSNPEL